MKNKSKLKKIREKKAGTATVTKEWLYMNPNSITVAEIENALEGMDGIETEIWKEAGVLEVEVPEHHSMDIEEIAVNLKDEYANAYLKEHDIHALFAVTIDTRVVVTVSIFACIEHSPVPVWIKKAGCYFYYLCNLYGSSVFFWSMADY